MTRNIATLFGIGLISMAPGTWGSLAALPLAYLLHFLGSFPLLAAATLIVFLVGYWAAAVETRGQENHDPSEIVIDEVVGQWLALFPISAGLWLTQADPANFPWPGWVVSFLAFRFFDIVKPWPVSWADAKETPLGLMLDDVLAGVMAALVVLAIGFVVQSVT